MMFPFSSCVIFSTSPGFQPIFSLISSEFSSKHFQDYLDHPQIFLLLCILSYCYLCLPNCTIIPFTISVSTLVINFNTIVFYTCNSIFAVHIFHCIYFQFVYVKVTNSFYNAISDKPFSLLYICAIYSVPSGASLQTSISTRYQILHYQYHQQYLYFL